MANGGFEIPVEILPKIQESGKTADQYFADLANKGVDAINKIANAAGQPIKQEIALELKDNQMQVSIKETTSLLKKMERAMEAAKKKEQAAIKATERQETAFRKKQIKQIEMIRKAESRRIAEVEKRAVAARKLELEEMRKLQAAANQQAAAEAKTVAIIKNKAAAQRMGLEPQRGSLAYAQQQLSTGQQRLNNLNQQSAAYKRQEKRVQNLTKNVNKLKGTSQNASMSIVSGFIKAQIAMAAVAAALNLVRDGLRKMGERRDMIDSMTTSFKAFGLSAQDAANGMENNLQVAMTYGADLNSLDKTLRRITPAITLMGGSMGDAQSLTEALAKRTAMLGLNTEQTGRYLEAFAQVMGKGKLQSEELNQQFSELDGALRGQVAAYLQANHGITNLNKAMERGEVKAHMFANAFSSIVASSKGLNELKFDSFDELMTQLKNGEITLKQFNSLLETMHLDNLKNLGKLFGDTLIAVKGLQLALVNMFDSENAKWFFDAIDIAMRTLVISAKGLVLIILAVGKALSDLPKAVEGWPIIGAAMKWLGGAAKGMAFDFKVLEESVDLALEELLDMPEKTEKAGDGVTNLQGAVREAVPAIEAWEPVLKKASKELGSLAAASYKSKDAQEALEDGLTAFKQKIEDQVDAYKELKKEIREKIKLEEIDAVAGEEQIKAIDAQIKAMKRKGKEIEENTKRAAKEAQENVKALNQISAAAANAGKTAAASANTAANGMIKWKASIKETFAASKLLVQQTQSLAATYDKLMKFNTSIGSSFGTVDQQMELLNGTIEQQQQEVEGLLAKYAQAVAMGYDLTKSEEAIVESLRKTSDELEKQAAAYDRANAAKKNFTTDFGVDQDIVNAVLSGARGESWAVQGEGGNWTIDWSKMQSGARSSDLQKLRDLQDEMNRLQANRNKLEHESNALGDTRANTQKQINELLRGGNEEMQKAVELQRKLTSFNNVSNLGYDPSAINALAGARASGGPVSGGSTYQVNELGREGFLSASGRLSEINVPAFGSWKAPTSGEVIPAHVWSELKAAGSAVTSSASRLASTGASGMVSHIRQSGDVDNSRVTNHVTIQSASPIQAASEVMVAAAKRRRRRFR